MLDGESARLLSEVSGKLDVVRFHCFPQKRGRGVMACISPCHGEGWGSNPPVSAIFSHNIFFSRGTILNLYHNNNNDL